MKILIILNRLVLILLFLLVMPSPGYSKVKEIKISNRKVVNHYAGAEKHGAYEVLSGTIIFEVNPNNLSNIQIVDLQLADVNSSGFVEFYADFELHKPLDAEKGNKRLICFVPNRSSKMGEGIFNYLTDKNWLYDNGWSYLYIGWNCDVPISDQALNINVPIAKNDGKEINGTVYSEIISFSNDTVNTMPIVWGGSLSYEPSDSIQTKATLTMCKYRSEKPILIKRSEWKFGEFKDGNLVYDPETIYLKDGFSPGWLYDLVYEAKNPKITGLGMAAIRDIVSFLRYSEKDEMGNNNPLAGSIDHTFAWGHSQSARLLNHFVHENFNQDENSRIVFDGILASCPGAGRGSFNSRFAQFTRHGSHLEDNLYPIDVFPFASVIQTESQTGESGSAYQNSKESGTMPKIMILNSSTDYWTRGASLLHTNLDGTRDLQIDEDVRIYLASSMAHTDSRLGILDRALLTALDNWVSIDRSPPASEIPRISDGTLVTLEKWKENFPKIPGIILPESYYMPLRLNNNNLKKAEESICTLRPESGEPYITLIPQVDKDGNDIAGIRLPEISVPIASNCGWAQRSPAFSNSLKRNAGKSWMFSVTQSDRIKKEDPRLSILERYPKRMSFINSFSTALEMQEKEGFILKEDVEILKEEAAWVPFWTESAQHKLEVSKVICSSDTVRPGEICKFVIQFEEKSIKYVKVELREAPFLNSHLKINSSKGIWEGSLSIPMDAPEGVFNFDFLIMDNEFNIIDRNNILSSNAPTVVFTIIKD